MTEALNKLIEAVEAGNAGAPEFMCLDEVLRILGWCSFLGDLNAAKALHEALLPGWSCAMNTNGGAQTISQSGERWHGQASDNPARAWLLAILKAYAAQQEATP